MREKLSKEGSVLFRFGKEHWSLFTDPQKIIKVEGPGSDAVPSALEQIDAALQQGLLVFGYLGYECSPAFDPVYCIKTPEEDEQKHLAREPLLWFGVYHPDQRVAISAEELAEVVKSEVQPWSGAMQPALGFEQYQKAIKEIKNNLTAGQSYQVNYTFPMFGEFEGQASDYFLEQIAPAENPYSAFINTGEFQICSASPELFFQKQGQSLQTKPMKGTRPRGMWRSEDSRLKEELIHSEKDQAENLMIVDMIRNDLGKFARPGSVQVHSLFDVNPFKTVWQMTSSIHARSELSSLEVLKNLFPCASITGAPKVRTMEIIRETEVSRRGVYTGSIGYIQPNGDACFNVAIRTSVIHSAKQSIRYCFYQL